MWVKKVEKKVARARGLSVKKEDGKLKEWRKPLKIGAMSAFRLLKKQKLRRQASILFAGFSSYGTFIMECQDVISNS